MKIWYGYGSEHSANLVIIGRFKDAATAAEAVGLLTEMQGLAAAGTHKQADKKAFYDVLMRTQLIDLTAADVDALAYDHSWQQNGNSVNVETEESDIQAIIKIMLHKGAKIELYSAHDYPETGYGRGG